MSRKNAKNTAVVALEVPAIATVNEVKTITIVSSRKVPSKLSKSMIISILDRAGYTVKQIVACSDELLTKKIIVDKFVESHVRNSINDFRLNAYKAKNADIVAESVKFELPVKHNIVVLTNKQQFEQQLAASIAASTTAAEPATNK